MIDLTIFTVAPLRRPNQNHNRKALEMRLATSAALLAAAEAAFKAAREAAFEAALLAAGEAPFDAALLAAEEAAEDAALLATEEAVEGSVPAVAGTIAEVVVGAALLAPRGQLASRNGIYKHVTRGRQVPRAGANPNQWASNRNT